ncbi:MAG: hypothetical protein AB1705_08505 [Verrucomicrobiota bacterium]
MARLHIDELDDVLEYDGMKSFAGGMDGYTPPEELGLDVCAVLENCLVQRNGRVKSRYGADALSGAAVAASKVQGLCYFDTPSLELLVAAVNAALYKWDGAAWAAIAGYAATDASTAVTIVQGIDKVYIADGTKNLHSWDGAAAPVDLGSGLGNPPAGASILLWHQTNRLFAAGIATEPDTIYASDILDAGPGAWNHATFKFRVGAGEGDPIIGLVRLPGYWLGVIKRNSIYLVNADPAAATAADWQIPFQTQGVGCVGKRAFVQFGNEALLLARDGIRSVRRMAAAEQQFEIVPPISDAVKQYIDRINWAQASKVAAWRYKELAFFALPLDSATEPSHVIVWNEQLQRWLGVWNGWTPTCFATTRFNDQDRLVIGDTTGRVNQWKDYADEGLESTYQDNGANFTTKLRTRTLNFRDKISTKDGEFVEIEFIESSGTATVTAYYDDEEAAEWIVNMEETTNQLPLALPFDLATTQPTDARRSQSDLSAFKEMYLEIEKDDGKLAVKAVTAAAFLNTVEGDQNA